MLDLVWHLKNRGLKKAIQTSASKLASKFGKVVLAGTGSDEMFGSYPWRYYRAVVITVLTTILINTMHIGSD